MIGVEYCPNCGHKTQHSNDICQYCGHKYKLISDKSASENPNFKKVLIFFMMGIIVYKSLNNLVSNFVLLSLLNSHQSLFFNDFPNFFAFITEIAFFFFLVKLLNIYDIKLSKSNLKNCLLQILIFAGISSGTSILIANYLLYPFVNSFNPNSGVLTFYNPIISPNELITYLLGALPFDCLSFLLLFLFALVLKNRTKSKYNQAHQKVYFEFLLITFILGIFSLITFTGVNSLRYASFILRNGIIYFLFIELIFGFSMIIIPSILAIISSKFLHFPITESILFNFIFIFAFTLSFSLIGLMGLYHNELRYVFPGQSILVLFLYLGIYNSQVTLNLAIYFFSLIYLIQIYNPKILFKDSNQQTSKIKSIFNLKNLFQKKNNRILEKINIDKSLETIEQILNENSENQ